jgi:hypothetical protein
MFRRGLAATLSLVVLLVLACQDPTQARVFLYTDVPHGAGLTVGLWAGATPPAEPQSKTTGPWVSDGFVGTLVTLPPSGQEDGRLDIQVVMGLGGRDPKTCSVQDANNCIIARRRLRFLPNTKLEVPVGLFLACQNNPCTDDTTCNSKGQCVSRELDPDACARALGCILPGDPEQPPGVQTLVPEAGPGPDVEPPPAPSPSVSYLDRDPSRGKTQGQLVLTPPADTSLVSDYVVEWASADGASLGNVVTFPKGAPAFTKTIDVGTVVPAGAEFFRARSVGPGRPSAPVTVRADNYLRLVDVGADAGADVVITPVALVDTARSKLLIVGRDLADRPVLRRCDLDGSACEAFRLDAGLGYQSAASVAAALDGTGKLVVITQNVANQASLSLFRCDADGKACTHKDLGQPGKALTPRVAIDDVAGKFVVSSRDAAGTLYLTRCALDGTACTSVDMSQGTSPAGAAKSADIAVASGAVYVAYDGAQDSRPHLQVCAQDGTQCSDELIATAGAEPQLAVSADSVMLLVSDQDTGGKLALHKCALTGKGCAATPIADTQAELTQLRAAYSPTDQKLFAVAKTTAGKPRLYRCNVQGAPQCGFDDIAVTDFAGSGESPSVALSSGAGGERVLVVTSNGAKSGKPWLFRCERVFGASCSVSDLSAQGNPLLRGNSGGDPALVVDADRGRVIVATQNDANQARSALFLSDTLSLSNASGTAAQHQDSAAGRAGQSGLSPSVLIDDTRTEADGGAAAPRILIVTTDRAQDPSIGARLGRPSLFRCNLDGTGCSFLDLSAGQPAESGVGLNAMIDRTEKNLLVVSKPGYLFRCRTDGNSCLGRTLPGTTDVLGATFDDAGRRMVLVKGQAGGARITFCSAAETPVCTESTPGFANTAQVAQVFLDTKNQALLVVSVSPTGLLERARCNLDGAGCQVQTLALDLAPVAVTLGVDPAFGFVYVATSSASRTLVHRCTADLVTCEAIADLPGAVTGRRGIGFDPAQKRLLLALRDTANLNRPALGLLDLY